MNSYMGIAAKYLSMHRRRTNLTILSIAISVALITGIFSMLDVFLQFEKAQIIHDTGNYHIIINNASQHEIAGVKSRIDVQNSGRWLSLGSGSISGVNCNLGALDENFAVNMNIKIIEGEYPVQKDQVMIEQWASQSLYLNLKVNDAVKIALPDNTEREFTVSGIYSDLGNLKAAGVPGVILSIDAAEEVFPGIRNTFLVEFKDGVNIANARQQIIDELNIADERMGFNERLLAAMGQSSHNSAMGIYATGAVLFLIVLIAGVVMIYNTFNISVMERVRQFGLLRCVGASRSQVKRIVMREGLCLTLRAVPLGVTAGMVLAFICSGVLKFYNGNIFGDIPLFSVSVIGISAGIAAGLATTYISSLLPAKKASRVSPVNAVTGVASAKSSKRRKLGLLTRVFHPEIAMGIGNAAARKKTLFLMACSISISIIMFLGFNVFINFMYSGIKTTKPYTPDISLISEKGIDRSIYERLQDIDGVKKVYGRMFGYVSAAFDASRLTDAYRKNMGNIVVNDSGLFVPHESSWLISYDRDQFDWARADLIDGEIDMDSINKQNGVIAVAVNTRNNITSETAFLKVGDRVYVDTVSGVRELTVMGILRSVPFSDTKLNLTSFITTESIFTQLTGESTYKAVDVQVISRNHEQTVDEIKKVVDGSMSFRDLRQKNTENDQTFLTMAVFVYGFVVVIALISILNIISTMNTSVASKTRYLGVMRAVGMSGSQLNKMVLAEAAAYSITGCISGCILGTLLQNMLVTNILSPFHMVWEFPIVQIILIIFLTMAVTAISVIGPLKRVKAMGISEVVNSL